MAKEILFNIDARDQLKKGIDTLRTEEVRTRRYHRDSWWRYSCTGL